LRLAGMRGIIILIRGICRRESGVTPVTVRRRGMGLAGSREEGLSGVILTRF